MHTKFLLYRSSTPSPLLPCEINDILSKSYTNNRRDSLTGFLYCEQGVVIQYLEGPGDRLKACVDRIKLDPRHGNMEITRAGTIQNRRFPDWQMGLVEQAAFSLTELAEAQNGELDLLSLEPMDLIVFLAANADHLRYSGQAA